MVVSEFQRITQVTFQASACVTLANVSLVKIIQVAKAKGIVGRDNPSVWGSEGNYCGNFCKHFTTSF